MESPQSIVPVTRTTDQYIRAQVLAQKLVVAPARIVTVASTANTPILEAKNGVAKRSLHNVGTTVVVWKVGGVPTVDDYHGVLAAGSAANDGLGSLQDLSDFKGDIYIISLTGAPRVCVFEATGPEAEVENFA